MKTEMRRELARQPFEQKIRRVGQLQMLPTSKKHDISRCITARWKTFPPI